MFYHSYVNLCNKRGISPSAAAEEMGFHRSDVTRWSKGAQPRRATAQKVAEYFNVPISELVGDTVEAKKESSPQIGELMYPEWYRELTPEEVEQVQNYAYFLISERRKDQP